jgi:hypothetical protein
MCGWYQYSPRDSRELSDVQRRRRADELRLARRLHDGRLAVDEHAECGGRRGRVDRIGPLRGGLDEVGRVTPVDRVDGVVHGGVHHRQVHEGGGPLTIRDQLVRRQLVPVGDRVGTCGRREERRAQRHHRRERATT